MSTGDVRDPATAWIAADVDDQDKADLTALLADTSPQAAAELADRFARRLTFGTAGLRGAVAAGPNRMNTATVTATTPARASACTCCRAGSRRRSLPIRSGTCAPRPE